MSNYNKNVPATPVSQQVQAQPQKIRWSREQLFAIRDRMANTEYGSRY